MNQKTNQRLEYRRNMQFFLARNIPHDCPDDCDFLLVTEDVNGTGDSPTGYECEAPSRRNCPLWDQVK